MIEPRLSVNRRPLRPRSLNLIVSAERPLRSCPCKGKDKQHRGLSLPFQLDSARPRPFARFHFPYPCFKNYLERALFRVFYIFFGLPGGLFSTQRRRGPKSSLFPCRFRFAADIMGHLPNTPTSPPGAPAFSLTSPYPYRISANSSICVMQRS